MRRLQEARGSLYERTRQFEVYMSTVARGFLQVPGYATALMSSITAFQDTPDDVAEAIRARMSRNRMLNSEGRRFTLLIEESVLRYRVGDDEAVTDLILLPAHGPPRDGTWAGHSPSAGDEAHPAW